MSHDHGLSSRVAGGGRGGHFPYMPQAGMFMPSMQGGGRWMGGGGMPPAGLSYPRRDMVGGAMRTPPSWDTRGIPPAFLSTSQLKSSALRCVVCIIWSHRCALFDAFFYFSRNVSMYSALQQGIVQTKDFGVLSSTFSLPFLCSIQQG